MSHVVQGMRCEATGQGSDRKMLRGRIANSSPLLTAEAGTAQSASCMRVRKTFSFCLGTQLCNGSARGDYRWRHTWLPCKNPYAENSTGHMQIPDAVKCEAKDAKGTASAAEDSQGPRRYWPSAEDHSSSSSSCPRPNSRLMPDASRFKLRKTCSRSRP